MTMCSPCANTALPVLGLPIRKATDQRLFNASPWLIAVVHALHRLLVPRHPPFALDILTVIARRTRKPDDDETQFLKLASCAVFKVRKRSKPRGTPVAGLSKLSSARAPAPFEWIRLKARHSWWSPNSCCTTRSGRHS